MRTPTATATTQSQITHASNPIIIVAIKWDGSTSTYYSQQDLGLADGTTTANAFGYISNVNDISEQMTTGSVGNLSNISISLFNVTDKTNAYNPLGVECIIYQAYLDSDTALITGSETLMFSGILASPITWSEKDNTTTFDAITIDASGEYGFSMEDGDGITYTFNQDTEAISKPWPLVFGTVKDVPALRVQEPGVCSLDEPLRNILSPVAIVDGDKMTQSTSMTLLIGRNVCTGTIVGDVMTLTEANLSRYPSITVKSMVGDADEDVNNVLVVDGDQRGIVNYYCYDARSGKEKHNLCFRAVYESASDQTRCYFRKSWGAWKVGAGTFKFIIDRPTALSETAYLPRTTWVSYNPYQISIQAQPEGTKIIRLTKATGLPHEDSKAIYIANYYAGTVLAVKAFRNIDGENVLVNVPSSYYTVDGTDDVGLGFDSTTLTFDVPIEAKADEKWGSVVYVSQTSTVSGNTGFIITKLIDDFSSLNQSVLQIVVKTANYPSNFVIYDKGDTLQLCQNIAWQARCALTVRNGTVYGYYLSEDPTTVDDIEDTDIEAKSMTVSLSDETEVITKMTGIWRSSYVDNEDPKTIVKTKNTSLYGTKDQEYDFTIYNVEEHVEKSMTFWLNRYANVWKRFSYSSFMNTFQLEVFDPINIAITPDTITTTAAGVSSVIESISVQPATGSVNIDVWTEVLAGTMVASSDAWLDDSSDTLIDIDVSSLSMYDYIVETELARASAKDNISSYRPEYYEADEGKNNQFEQQEYGRVYNAIMLEPAPDARSATARFTNHIGSDWSDATVTYELDTVVIHDGESYYCNIPHISSSSIEPGVEVLGYWVINEKITVNIQHPDSTITLRDTEQDFVNLQYIQVMRSLAGDWYIIDMVTAANLYPDNMQAVVQSDASTGSTISCKVTASSTTWSADTYYPRHSFVNVSGSGLYMARFSHYTDSDTVAVDHPSTGTSASDYWEDFSAAFDVDCNLYDSLTDLQDASPTLAADDIINIAYINSNWECTQSFHAGGSVAVISRAQVQATQTNFSTGIVSVKKLDSTSTEVGSAFNVYAFASGVDTIDLADCRPLLSSTGTWSIIFVTQNIDGNWYMVSPTVQEMTKISVQSNYTINGTTKIFDKTVIADVEVPATGSTTTSTVHTGTTC